MQEKVVLPKTYDDPFGNYPQHKGKPKISYSQYTSFVDSMYKGSYFGQYFLGVKDEGNIFSDFGGKCGEYWEKEECADLSEADVKILKDTLDRPEGARYEVEVVIDRGSYVIQGFIDRELELKPKTLEILDLKTGNHKDKPAFYGGKEYQQTTLYCYQREKEGNTIAYSGVKLLERKGNGSDKYPLKLSGKVLDIPTPYSKERAEEFLDKMDGVVLEISKYYQAYQKLFT
jgi:hypothetical protein